MNDQHNRVSGCPYRELVVGWGTIARARDAETYRTLKSAFCTSALA